MRDEELPVELKEPNRKQGEEAKQSRWGFRGMTVRDWLELFIVPLSLVVIGLVFTIQQDARQRELEEQRAQDAALQAYLDQISHLMLEKNLRNSEEASEVRTLARARTLTVLRRLDPSRKADVMNFLMEAGLIQRRERGRSAIIRLGNADLSGTDLSYPHLDLAQFEGRTLFALRERGFDLSWADLTGANLSSADLSGVDLSHALLFFADLHEANLSDANLSGAALTDAVLRDTTLSGALLSGADLRGADLTNATVTQEQLYKAASLKGATMPNGQKYEDWLKSKGSGGETTENSAPS